MAHRIGALVRRQRLARGLTQADLAALCGLSHQTIKQYEQGWRMPPLAQIVRMARVCDMPLALFLGPLDE